jgi:hypothetical protein
MTRFHRAGDAVSGGDHSNAKIASTRLLARARAERMPAAGVGARTQTDAKEIAMRKIVSVLTVATTVLTLPIAAQAARYRHRAVTYDRPVQAAAPVNDFAPAAAAGAVAGTVAAVGTYNAWWGTSAAAAALPASAVGSAAFGGVVGVGTLVTIDAVVQPCRGLHALFDLNHGACVNGEYVGYAPPPARYRQPG